MSMEQFASFNSNFLSFSEDTSAWLPESLRKITSNNNDPSEWPKDPELIAFLEIILAIKQSDLDLAISLIDCLSESTTYRTALCILRARVHFLMRQYDEVAICLDAAASFGEDKDLLVDALREFASLLDRTETRTKKPNAEPSDSDLLEYQDYEAPTFENTIFVVQASHKADLEKLIRLFEVHAAQARIFVMIPAFDFIELSGSIRISYGINDENNSGSSQNSALMQMSFENYQYIAVVDENVALEPNTINLIFADYSHLRKTKDKRNLGWLIARTNNATGSSETGVCPTSEKSNEIKFPRKFVYADLPLMSSTVRIIERQNWISCPPIQQFSTEVQCLDMEALGLNHFVSRACCHHVRSVKSDTDKDIFIGDSSEWISQNRPHYLQILGIG